MKIKTIAILLMLLAPLCGVADVRFLRIAAEASDAVAQFQLGTAYGLGDGVSGNAVAAR